MKIEEKLDILIEEVRLLRAAIAAKPSSRRTPGMSAGSMPVEISDETISRLNGIMTAREVCMALGVEYSKSNTTAIGAKLNSMGVKRIRTKATRLFDFGNEDVEILGNTVKRVRDNMHNLRGMKTISAITSALTDEPTSENMVMVSKALRHIGVQQDQATGHYKI